MKVKWMTAAMIAAFSGALVVGTAASAGGMGGSHSSAQGSSFSKLDTNKDGHISASEAAANPTLAKDFKRIDKNKDGKIERAEFSRFETTEGGSRGTMKHGGTGGSKDQSQGGGW